MRFTFGILLFFATAAGFNILTGQKAPEKVTFAAKNGNVTFDHTAHVKRANNDCTGCHDKLFQKSNAPLNYKSGIHKAAEASKSSCAGCHDSGGTAFETKGNCSKCHVKN